MSEPRGHHLLAKLYQRGFATTKGAGQVTLVAKESGRHFTTSIEKAFKENDWNAFVDEAGNRRQDFEKMLADEIDSPAGTGFAALRAGMFPLPDDQRGGVGRFIAAQVHRGRRLRDATEAFIDDVDQKVLALCAQHHSDEWWDAVAGRALTADEREEFIKGDVERPPTRRAALETIAVVNETAPLLQARNWVLVEFPEPCLFTSEAPIWMSDRGIGSSQEIRIPITPRSVLLLVSPDAGLAEGKRELDHGAAENVNLGTLLHPHADMMLLCPTVEHHPLPDFDAGWKVGRAAYDYLRHPAKGG